MKIIQLFLLMTIYSNANAFSINFSDIGKIIDAGTKVVEGYEGLTEEQEYYLGRAVSARILGYHPYVPDQVKNDYVNNLVVYLAWHSSRPETFGGYHGAVFESEVANAFSAPGGLILISSSLLNGLENEDELAAILAHEIAHIGLKHGLSTIKESNLAQAAGILGAQALKHSSDDGFANMDLLTASFGSSVDDVVSTVTTAGYSRSQELEADQEALKILYKAGYSTEALSIVLKRQQQNVTKVNDEFLSSMTVTHPGDSDRMDKIERFIRSENIQSKMDGSRTQRFESIIR